MEETYNTIEKQINVLHVVSNISIRNGVMSCLMNYYRNMRNTMFSFMYFDDRDVTYEQEIIELGGGVIKVPRPNHPKLLHTFFGENSTIQKNKYDIIEVHDPFIVGFFSCLKKKWGIKKIIVHSHSTRFSDSMIGEIRNRFFSLGNYFIPDEYFACSYDAGISIFGKKFLNKGIVVNNAIDLKKYQCKEIRNNIRRKYNLENKFVIGHVGNFTAPKNHFFIVEIFIEVCKKRKDAVLVLIGEGSRKNKVEEIVRNQGLQEKVVFLGVRNDVNELLQLFDCFLFPSLYEGLGIALVEAQAAGIPCVFSDVIPNETNIIKNQNTILSLKDSSEKWAEAVCKSVIKKDGDCKELMEKSGYNIHVEAKKLFDIYNNIIGG